MEWNEQNYAKYFFEFSLSVSLNLFIEQVLVIFFSHTSNYLQFLKFFGIYDLFLHYCVGSDTHTRARIPSNSFNFKLNKHHMSWTETNVIDTSHSNLQLVNIQHTAQRQKQ